jgi:hypothetical protein
VPKKLTIEHAKRVFSDSGCELLEDTYHNSQTPMKYICVCGKESKICLNSFKQGNRCQSCGAKRAALKTKHSFEYVYNFFKENDCLLLETEYKNSNTLMNYKCTCGNKAFIRFDCFKQGKRCNECAKVKRGNKRKLNIEDVRKYFSESGCKLLEDEYKDNRTPMWYLCACGNESKISYSNFQKGRRCYHCALVHRSGENASNYNPNLTEEERQKGRKYSEYYAWRSKVYERDNFTCKCCNKKGGYLIAHHLDGYHWSKEKRTDVDNGVTLCKTCHDDFHSIYGRKNNTRKQFDEFYENKRNEYEDKDAS